MVCVGKSALEYVYMGLFTTNSTWVHPRVCEKTYELIYVIEGEVHLREGERCYHLKEKDLILLSPGVTHEGNKESHGKTSFYWVHFHLRDGVQHPTELFPDFQRAALFKELLHYANLPVSDVFACEATLLHLLAAIRQTRAMDAPTALAASVVEWTRINARNGLTVRDIATQFNYNAEYLTRVVRRSCGKGLKALLNEFVLEKAKNQLCTTTRSVKEIASLLGFPTPHAFIHFYEYHEGISPTRYRNLYPYTHMNQR